jgi:multiple antibiotic resistance protein
MLQKIVRDFMMIWTTVDPIGTLALFAGLTASLDRRERRGVARRASIYAAVILIVAVVIGQIVLDAIGIHLLSLQLAGGLILFVFALQMLLGRHDPEPGRTEPGHDLAVFPIAVPSIAGPGAIMAVIILTDNDVYTPLQQAETAAVLLFVLFLNYVMLLLSEPILRIIGQQGASILVRVMGIILAALSVQLVMNALGIGVWATIKR